MEAAPLQGKIDLLEKMAQRRESQEKQQQKMEEMEEIQKQLELSHIDQNTALAEERRARVLADIGLAKERISEQDQNYARALLDNARTVKEIQDIDNKRLFDVMELAATMRMQEQESVERQLDRDAQRSKPSPSKP
jgi:hypothetical protein